MSPTPSNFSVRQSLDLFTEEEVACALDIKVQTLRAWRAKQEGPLPTKLGKGVFYRGLDLRAWFERNLGFASETPPTES